MKILLVAVAILVAVEEWAEAHPQGWRPYSGFQNERGNNPGYGSSWAQQWMENNGFSSEIEWVCQNPRTKDIMIIASDNTQHTPQHHANRGPWWQRPHNVPPGHQKKENSDGNYWNEVKPTSQETSNTDRNQIPFTTDIPNNNNRQTCTTQPAPHYHGGEGSIDVRVGEN